MTENPEVKTMIFGRGEIGFAIKMQNWDPVHMSLILQSLPEKKKQYKSGDRIDDNEIRKPEVILMFENIESLRVLRKNICELERQMEANSALNELCLAC